MKKRLFIVILLLPLFSGAQTGLFRNAAWITVSQTEDTVNRPCPVFLRSFGATKAVRSARLYITTLGLYEARINGERVGKDYFTPGFTNYNRRLQYLVYDVTRLIHAFNRLAVTIGEGWYRGVFRGAKPRDNYGSAPGLLAVLQLDYKDGTQSIISTDGRWKYRFGSVRSSGIYDGEVYDSNFADKDLFPVKYLEYPHIKLIPAEAPAVRQQEHFELRHVSKDSAGHAILDFGQNLAGWVKVLIRGKRGDTLRIRHAEMLDRHGNLYTGNLREARATDTYMLNGRMQVLEPHFTYHGFRYAQVELIRNGRSIPVPVAVLKRFRAIALYSDLPKTGTFACSDPLLNRLQQNIEWSLNSNFLEIPTDCPQRSERLGWTGDAQVFCATASFLRDTKSFYNKWLKDLATEQGRDGGVPTVVPTVEPDQQNVYGVAGWGDAAVMIPWDLYRFYGDEKVLSRSYAAMKAWVDYMTRNSPQHLFQNKGYGDWYAMGDSTSISFIDQCFYAHSTELLLQTARTLGQQADSEKYSRLLDSVKSAFNKAYGCFDFPACHTQTAYVLALQFDLLPVNKRQAAADSLTSLIRANHDRLATGFLGTPYLLEVLSRFGYTDRAYRLLLQRECPSWLYPVVKGATTIWERWDAIDPEDDHLQACSYNHYAYGAVGRWMYEHITGIQPLEPGYRKVLIAPEPGGNLRWATGSYRSRYGLIKSSWKIDGKNFRCAVSIPKGITAEIKLPGDGIRRKFFGPGNYNLVSKL